MAIDIRTVPADQLRRWMDAVNVAFGEPTDEAQWQLDQALLEPERTLGAYDGEALVGGGAAFSFRMTVPGGAQARVAGVTAVGVLPTHRRRGILRSLMARQLDDVRRNGEPLAALVASEGNIYQRFGYGLGILLGAIDIERDRAAFRTDVEPVGSIRLVDRDEARRLMPLVYDQVCGATPGFIARDPAWWDERLADIEAHRRGAGPQYRAIYERDGEVRGFVRYRIKNEWTSIASTSTLFVQELIGIDPEADRELWRFIFGVDLIARIQYRWGPASHPLLLMVSEPRRLQLRVSDGIWLRIVDVPAALQLRGYATDGEIVLDVSDTFLPGAAGRWRLKVSGGKATVEPTTDPADLALDTTDLAAVYMGSFNFADLARAARTTELTSRARERADRLFSIDVRPWCSTPF
ncbi:MAG TPA: GNAT family N-acetyltransferase [Candidatus Limnocylindria bacterium]|nr:GNAT family N-acetyltransferase [Candidatus Limnocylindria bacterium]